MSEPLPSPSEPPELPDAALADRAEGKPIVRRRRRRDGSPQVFVEQLTQGMPRVWVTWSLLALNVLVFVTMVATGVSPQSPDVGALVSWGADLGPLTIPGEPWRLVTSAFVHIGVTHLLLNMWCLWYAGSVAERLLGHGGFASVYLFSALTGSLTSISWDPLLCSAGASGAIFGVIGALFACSRRLRGKVPDELFSDLRLSAGVFLAYNLFVGFADQSVDNAAHIGGLVGGYLGASILVRGSSDSVVRAPLLRMDYRFVPLLVVVLVVGCVTAWSRVDANPSTQLFRFERRLELAAASSQPEEMQSFLDGYLEENPDDANALVHRASFFAECDRFDEALRDADRAVAIDPANAFAYSHRAWALSYLSRFEEGATAARRALAIASGLSRFEEGAALAAPDQRLARESLVYCLAELKHGDYLREAKRAAMIHPESAMLHGHHGFALRQAGRGREALVAFESAFRLDPKDEWVQKQRAELRAQLQKAGDAPPKVP